MPKQGFQPFMESPLHHFKLDAEAQPRRADGRIWCNELPHLGYAVLRGDTAEAGFAQLVEQVTGLALPLKAGAVSHGPQGVLMWTSPDEWLLVSHRQRLADWTAQLDAGFAAQQLFAQTVDSSGGLTLAWLGGTEHITVLRHLGVYDFESIPLGHMVSTVLGKATVQVIRLDSDGVFVVFRRSFADYVWRLLRRAAQPYGFAVCQLEARSDHPLFAQLAAPRPSLILA